VQSTESSSSSASSASSVVAPPSTPRLLRQRPQRAPRIIKGTTTATVRSIVVQETASRQPLQTVMYTIAWLKVN